MKALPPAPAGWLASAPSSGAWAFRFGAANVLTVFATTAVVTWMLEVEPWWQRVLLFVVALTLCLLSAALLASASSIRESRFPRYPEIILAMTRRISSTQRLEQGNTVVSGVQRVRTAAVGDLKLYLCALEDLLAGAWSQERFGGRSSLEVVVMNRAVDGFVTVAAWANTRPLSLPMRASVPSFYENTEAAKLYRKYDDVGVRAPVHLIADVSLHSGYDHFGRDPRLRTNSTALFPIYDSQSRLHGFVAVTARERAGLFEEADRDFWTEAWSLWEPHLLRQILRYEATGALFAESAK